MQQSSGDADRALIEAELIAARRLAWREPAAPSEPAGAEALESTPAVGLALSGGGIRSATFSLGVVQALAADDKLRAVDYLSTVSGGGYTGAFLCSLLLPRQANLRPVDPAGSDTPAESPRDAALRAQRILTESAHATRTSIDPGGSGGKMQQAFHPLRWLRENGRYLTPGSSSDTLYLAAFYLRSLIGVHYVLGLVLIGLALALYTTRLGFSAAFPAPVFGSTDWAWHVAEDAPRLWISPLLRVLPLGIVLLVAGPLILTYWVVYRQEQPLRRTLEEWSIELGPWLLTVGALLASLIVGLSQPHNWLYRVLLYLAYLGAEAIIVREIVLRRVLAGEPGGGLWWHHGALVAAARQRLTRWLTTALHITLIVAFLGLIDSLGQSLFIGLMRREWGAWGTSGISIAAAVVILRRLGQFAFGRDAAEWLQWIVRYQKLAALLFGLLALLALATVHAALVQAVVWSAVLAAWFENPERMHSFPGDSHLSLLLLAWLVWAFCFGLTALSISFLNASSFHRFYSARLVRTFLGAANFERLHRFAAALDAKDDRAGRKQFVSVANPSDDLPLRAYYGVTSAAPLHLINVTLNESISRTSSLQRDDRKGLALTVGPAGIGVGNAFWCWQRGSADNIGFRIAADEPPPASTTDKLAPARAMLQRHVSVERLAVGSWVAISGAAVSTGLGALSSRGFSILSWIANARLGYWWQPATAMTDTRPTLFAVMPNTYKLMKQEMFGAFVGRPATYWNLSDGGHFENTGVYELVRRQVPLIVCSDNGADPKYEFKDLQNLVRRVRVDFGAEICLFDKAALATFIERWYPEFNREQLPFATLDELLDPQVRGQRCVMLAWIEYPSAQEQAPPRRSLLVLIKPTLFDAAPLDVRQYGRHNPEFPQQPTADQFFDEAQWESYRKLGYVIGETLCVYWQRLHQAAGLAAARCYEPDVTECAPPEG